MAKSNQTANDAQLKARRTSLGKKSKDELIGIILRKDSTERKNNAKIQELTTLLKEANKLNEENTTRIHGFEMDMKGMEDLSKTKQEQINSLVDENNTLREQISEWTKKYVEWSKNYVNLKNLSSIYRKVMFTCFGIIAILIILLIAS